MRWPWQRKRADEAENLTLTDPRALNVFGFAPNYSGVQVGEGSTLGISAVYRAVALIASTIASLPLRALRDIGDGQRQRMTSFVDTTPAGPDGPTRFEWLETIMFHLLLHGNAYLAHLYNQAGALIGLVPIHPLAVTAEWETDVRGRHTGRKIFRATLDDGTFSVFTQQDMTQIMGPSLDGLYGLSVIGIARNSLGATIAGERSAAKMFSDGALMAGLVSAEEDLDEDEATEASQELNRKVGGWENAGKIAFVNRKLKFTPWTMSAADAQFIESRQFQIEEIARWFGVPPHLLMQTEKQTSWGTGVAEQNRGLGRFTLNGWTRRIEARLSRLLPAPRFVEFDFSEIERPDPETEIRLLIEQIRAGLITVNEARAIRNMPPLEQAPTPDPEGAPA